MTDVSTAAVAAVAAAVAVPAVVTPVASGPSLLSRLKTFRLKLHADWQWIISHSWSVRFMFMAFVLSGLEVFLPLFAGKTSINPVIYAGAIALVTGAAFVARLIAQKHEAPNAD